MYMEQLRFKTSDFIQKISKFLPLQCLLQKKDPAHMYGKYGPGRIG